MQVLDVLLSFWCTQALIPSMKTSQGQWSYGRITEQLQGSLMLRSEAIPNTKPNTHLHIQPLTGMTFPVFLLFLTMSQQTILGSSGTVAFPWDSLGVLCPTKAYWANQLLLGVAAVILPWVIPALPLMLFLVLWIVPENQDQSGQPLALVSGQILGDFSLVSSKKWDNFVTFSHMVLSRRSWEWGMRHLQSENSIFKELLLKTDWVMRSPGTLD